MDDCKPGVEEERAPTWSRGLFGFVWSDMAHGQVSDTRSGGRTLASGCVLTSSRAQCSEKGR
ncbi:hypothetical protein KTAU_09190 [Thermogemmatispora aurantia]|uniref:Uncharacterized protein n=1 Tax=Thermogemmatispora aurantia TaxID=2045279 RepID=A0A5J4K6B9_9CHLR|nr:hypothetical protein KTAU_09190 [Thermogemmatispora aurantia]